MIRSNIRGELTVAYTKEQFSLKDNSFISAVASSLQISSSEVRLSWCNVNFMVRSRVLSTREARKSHEVTAECDSSFSSANV